MIAVHNYVGMINLKRETEDHFICRICKEHLIIFICYSVTGTIEIVIINYYNFNKAGGRETLGTRLDVGQVKTSERDGN